MKRMKAAIKAYLQSLASVDHPYDMTDAIINPSFEDNGLKGWTAEEMGPQGNDSFSLKAGSIYVEKWTGRGGHVGDGSVRQTLTNLPSGNYRLRVSAQNIQEDTPTLKKIGAWIFADNQQTSVYRADKYEVDFTCITGEVEIGFLAKNASGNWIAVDNFQLFYLGMSEESNITQLQQRIDVAKELVDKHMNTDTLALLNAAIAAAQAYEPGQQLSPIALALDEAILKAEGSIIAYQTLHDAIESAQRVLADEGDNGRSELEACVASSQEKYDNLFMDNQGLDEAAAALKRAVFVFQIANGSGSVPVVSTHPEIIYGCKAAVGRMNVKGSNLLQQGFCWSTHPEPTVLDSMSTTYYDFNGRVYLIPDLQPSTTYYVRAFAMTRKYAVGYGDVVRIITLPEADVVYHYNMAGDDATNERIDNACKTAVYYLNIWTSIRGFRPNVNYDPGDDGAHGSYGGWITIGAAFAQNPGTVMHEMGHGIGVGQHWRYTSWDSPLHPTMYWTGERANRVFKFFENNPNAVADGDRVHVCYGLSGVTAPVDLLRQAAFYQGMYEDGLPAVGDGACPYHSFEDVEGEKYYLTNERFGIGTKFLAEYPAGKLSYQEKSLGELSVDDSFAWYVSYVPTTGFYRLRNALSGRYISFRSGNFSTSEVSSLTDAENIHLMPARKLNKVTLDDKELSVKPYWVARGNRVETPEVLQCYTAIVRAAQLDFNDTAIAQHWVFLSAGQVEELTTGIKEVGMEAMRQGVPHIYDLSGRRMNPGVLKPGIYIVNGKKTIIK